MKIKTNYVIRVEQVSKDDTGELKTIFTFAEKYKSKKEALRALHKISENLDNDWEWVGEETIVDKTASQRYYIGMEVL